MHKEVVLSFKITTAIDDDSNVTNTKLETATIDMDGLATTLTEEFATQDDAIYNLASALLDQIEAGIYKLYALAAQTNTNNMQN